MRKLKAIILLVSMTISFHGYAVTIKQLMVVLQKQQNVHFLYDASLNLDISYGGVDIAGRKIDDALKMLFDNSNIMYERHGHNVMLYKKVVNRKTYSVPRFIVHHVARHDSILPEVTVTGNLNSPLLTTQTGKRVMKSDDINTEFSLLSSPDLIKTLQHVSGVNSGVDFLSGLYVHGGGADENLFLIDDTPVYQINHSLGLFSAFNTDIIKDVEFYKSGFPARYSGRVSSITDVCTSDGNMQDTHGHLSLGLLDGRFQLEGPICNGKTSYNISLRRSWLDFIVKPLSWFADRKSDGEHFSFDYVFHDMNAKVVHRLNANNTLRLSFFSSNDKYGINYESIWSHYTTENKNRFSWGNTNVSLGWEAQPSVSTMFKVTALGAYSYSLHDESEEDWQQDYDDIRARNSLYVNNNSTEMFDFGVKADALFVPSRYHHVRFGGQFLNHCFLPQTIQQSYCYGSQDADTMSVESKCRVMSNEATMYFEDEMMLSPNVSANIGTSLSLIHVKGAYFFMFDPRLALKYQLSEDLSLKLSYSHMSQSIHRISSTFLELPTDFWVPTTKAIHPSISTQFAAGAYANLSRYFSLTLEAYFKRTDHILQFRDWMGVQPPATRWDKDVTQGKGVAYGIEIDGVYKTDKFHIDANYTLSWSKRKFMQIYNGWYNDQFDNRQRVNIMLRYLATEKISLYAGWTMHSGNRMTLPTLYASMPQMPDEISASPECGFVYEQPNNITMPAYHRLDIGANFVRRLSKGREGIWNVSIYNAYCRLNAMFARVMVDDDGTLSVRYKGYVPIIPSISYTLKF